MCAFCFSKIAENDNPNCPACRKPYDLSAITVPVKPKQPASPSNHHKSKSKQKSKRNNNANTDNSNHHSSRHHKKDDDSDPHHSLLSYDELANIRVRQRNLVYVVGLPLSLCDEQVLKSKAWFGGFGKIKKVHCNKKTQHASRNGSCAAYITFYKKDDAKRAIEQMNGRYLDEGRMLKATTGSTKYCSYFLSGSICSNPSKCLFLHDWANKEDVVTKGELNDFGSYNGHHNGHHNGYHTAITLNSTHSAEYDEDFGDFEEEQRRTANRTVLSLGGKKAKSSATSKISKFDYTKIVKQSIIKEQSQTSNSSAPKTPRSAAKSAAAAVMANANGSGPPKNGVIANGNVHSSAAPHSATNTASSAVNGYGMNGVHGVGVGANNQHSNVLVTSSSSAAASDRAFGTGGSNQMATKLSAIAVHGLHAQSAPHSASNQFSATPSPMMTANGHLSYAHINGSSSVNGSPSKMAPQMVKTPPVKPLKTRTKPPMGLRKQSLKSQVDPAMTLNAHSVPGVAANGSLYNGYSHHGAPSSASSQGAYRSNAALSGGMDSSGLSKSEKLTSQHPTEVAPPQISLDDTASGRGQRYQHKTVNFDNYVDVVSGDSHRMHVESKVTVKHQNGKMKPRSRSQSGSDSRGDHGGHSGRSPNGSRSKPTTPTLQKMGGHSGHSGHSKKQKTKRRQSGNVTVTVARQHREESHGEMAVVLMEELARCDVVEDREGSDSGSDYEEFKMSDLLRDGMWTADELMMDQYNYYYFVQSEQVIFEQFHHFNAQKVQKSVKSKA